MDSDGFDRALRVVVHQPALPLYRVPVFRELAKREGLSVLVLHGSGAGLPEAVPAGFEATPSPIRSIGPGTGLFWARDHWTLYTKTSPDVVVLNWNVRYLSLVPSILRARRRRVGTVLWGHGFSKTETPLRRWIRQVVGRLADVVVLYDDKTAREHITQHHFDAERVFVAPNTIDMKPIRSVQESVAADQGALQAFRDAHNLAQRTVLFVSRLDVNNRVDVLLEAVADLGGQLEGVRCIVIGSGPDLPRLTDLVAALNLGDTVTLVPGTYDEIVLAPWFLSADVFCYPSNAGLSLMHAFAYGLPVVVGDDRSSHNPEIEAVRDGENGLTFSHNDSRALAHVLRRIFTDTALRERLGAGARATAERSSLDRMVDGLELAIRAAFGRQR